MKTLLPLLLLAGCACPRPAAHFEPISVVKPNRIADTLDAIECASKPGSIDNTFVWPVATPVWLLARGTRLSVFNGYISTNDCSDDRVIRGRKTQDILWDLRHPGEVR